MLELEIDRYLDRKTERGREGESRLVVKKTKIDKKCLNFQIVYFSSVCLCVFSCVREKERERCK